MSNSLRTAARMFAVVALFAATAVADVTVDSSLPDYAQSDEKLSGAVTSIGSDTMDALMAAWSEEFSKSHPNVAFKIVGKGSSTAIPGLISGKSQFGPMSRKMKSTEARVFAKKFGHKPVQLGSAIDLMAVYVHPDNPVRSLTIPELDAVFSESRKQGHPKAISVWGDVGGSGNFTNGGISIYGRNSASGTYGFFRKTVLAKGAFKSSVKEQPGSEAVIAAIEKDPFAIGYSGIGYKTDHVRILSLGRAGAEPVPPTADHAYAGDYPLARKLWLTVNYTPGEDLPPVQREFLKFVFSKQGQTLVLKNGYYPVTADMAAEALAAVGVE